MLIRKKQQWSFDQRFATRWLRLQFLTKMRGSSGDLAGALLGQFQGGAAIVFAKSAAQQKFLSIIYTLTGQEAD